MSVKSVEMLVGEIEDAADLKLVEEVMASAQPEDFIPFEIIQAHLDDMPGPDASEKDWDEFEAKLSAQASAPPDRRDELERIRRALGR